MSHAAFPDGPKPHLNEGLNNEFLQTVIKPCMREDSSSDPEALVLNMNSKSLIHYLKLKVFILRKARI